MSPYLSVVPFVFFVLWVGAIVYGILLATRLVHAVESIARSLDQRPPR
jgi:hypothetical protein